MPVLKNSLAASEKHMGMRVDAVLAELLPALGLRARRRLVANGQITVDGCQVKPGTKLKTGSILEIWEKENAPQPPRIRLIGLRPPWCFFFKPCGLHTTAVAGGGASLEEQLPGLPEIRKIALKPILLQRLDFQTSGIVAAAMDAGTANIFKKLEKAGQCRKFYLAILSGIMAEEATARHALDTRHRHKTRVLNSVGDRATRFTPLAVWPCASSLKGMFPAGVLPDAGATLALCEISAGKRHQIRAHARALGHPLVGDALYGQADTDCFMLWHFLMEFAGLSVWQHEPSGLWQGLPADGREAFNRWTGTRPRSCVPVTFIPHIIPGGSSSPI